MLNIDGRKEQEVDDVSKLSDAQLIEQLADTAEELGIKINLNYMPSNHLSPRQLLATISDQSV